jgi:hypothetical protein
MKQKTAKILPAKKVRSQKTETFDVIIPVEYITRITVTNDFPNKRSKVQHKAGDELRRTLGDELFFSDNIKVGRAHSRQVK